MTNPIPATPPADAWSGERVARWLANADALDRQMAPIAELMFAAAAIAPGDTVLDIGCGHGPTTRAAAVLTGPAGSVTGLDISPDMLAAAAAAPVPAGAAPILWDNADAVTWSPPEARFDVLISRFGVMFFSDPPAALQRLARAHRPGGRLAFAVWARRSESPMFEIGYQAAYRTRVARGDEVEPLADEGGPFAWHDATKVRAMLEPAGWHDVGVTPHRLPVRFSGGVDAATAARLALDVGPTRTVLEGATEATRAAAQAEIEAALADYVDAAGDVVLDAEIRIVTARR